jgi:glycosyltransferase involved in cell wall biosynthesis
LDLKTVIDAARTLSQERDVRFVLCGTGSQLDSLRQLASDLPNVILPGFVGVPEIQWLLRRSTAGLAPWKPTPDFEATISNKVIEYWSAGVPVLTSLRRGVLVDLLGERDCGMSYSGDSSKLQEVIHKLLDQPKRQKSMSRNALALFGEKFTASKVYGEMADHLERIAAGFPIAVARAA